MRADGQKKPNDNFSEVVPKEMAENKPEVLVLQRDSITLTNLTNDVSVDFAKQQVLLSSYNMFSVATSALLGRRSWTTTATVCCIKRRRSQGVYIRLKSQSASTTWSARAASGPQGMETVGGVLWTCSTLVAPLVRWPTPGVWPPSWQGPALPHFRRRSRWPISSDTIYNSNFYGKTNFSKNNLFCKIFTQYTYVNSLPMLYKWMYVVFW